MIDGITIRCFVCKRTVDRAIGWHFASARSYRFEVWCHGDADSCEIPESFMAHADRSALKDLEGVAFAPKIEALPARPKAITHVR